MSQTPRRRADPKEKWLPKIMRIFFCCQNALLQDMICYDREYPESARILMLKGAEVILVPNDCGSMQPRIRALSTRAYENMVAVAMANPNGDN